MFHISGIRFIRYPLCSEGRHTGKVIDLETFRFAVPWLTQNNEEIHEKFESDSSSYGRYAKRWPRSSKLGYRFDQDLVGQHVPDDELFVPDQYKSSNAKGGQFS